MKYLDQLHPQITMRQLLAIAPQCPTKLGLAMIHKRTKIVEVDDITLSQNPNVCIIHVTTDIILIYGFQMDIGSSVNLMSMQQRNN